MSAYPSLYSWMIVSLPAAHREPTSQLQHNPDKKGLAMIANPLKDLVELRGIEPLTPRLPAGKGRKSQSLINRLVSRL